MKRSILCLVPFLLLSAPQRAISQIVYELPNSSAGLAASTFPVNPTYLPSPSFPAGSTITYGTPSLVVTKPAGVRFNSPIVVGPASCGFASVRPGGLTFDPIFPARVFATTCSDTAVVFKSLGVLDPVFKPTADVLFGN